MRKSQMVKLVITLMFIGGLLWFNHSYLKLSPVDIRSWMLSFGVWAPLLYIVIYTLRPLILFPATILTLAGGLAFGVVWGMLLTMVGCTAGAMLSFVIARKIGHRWFRKEWKGKLKFIEQQLEHKGFFYVLILRLLPGFPFDLISYASGLSKVKFHSFVGATVIGIIPGTFAYNFLGASILKGEMKHFLIAIAVLLAAFCIPFIIKRSMERD